MSQFGEQIRTLRKAAGLSLQRLGEKAGVSRFTLQRIEEDADVRLQTLEDVLSALGVELMIIPSELRDQIAQFVQSNGKVLGQQPGVEAPKSIVDLLSSGTWPRTKAWLDNSKPIVSKALRLSADAGPEMPAPGTDDEDAAK